MKRALIEWNRYWTISNECQLRVTLDDTASALGFDYWSALSVRERAGGSFDFTSVERIPPEMEELYRDRDASRRDPVMQLARHNSVPIAWNSDTYKANDCLDLYDPMADIGMKSGLLCAMHMPRGAHFVLGFDSATEKRRTKAELAWVMGQCLVATATVQAAISNSSLLKPNMPAGKGATLSPRELECLKWSAEGKTAWEIGTILGISENTSKKHLESAVGKLNCSNKLHAVAVAMREGLLDP